MLSGAALFATTVEGQTLFARPDTTPDYASYRHFDECMVAIGRVAEAKEHRGQTIWWDTVSAAMAWTNRRKLETRDDGIDLSHAARPDVAIQAGRVCLARFNADTATFKSVAYALSIFDALLLANRDEDAHRFAERFLDSMRARSVTDYKDQLQIILAKYVQSRSVRYAEAKQIHARILATVAGDSLYRAIDADVQLGMAAESMNDTAYADELAWRAIRTNDELPAAARKVGGDEVTRQAWMEGMLSKFTRNEGLDSLAISTLAYNLWKANTVIARINGTPPVTATDSSVKPYKVPDLVGEHYYTSTTGTSSGPSGQTQASYTKHGAVPPGTLPVKGRINFLTSLPSFCHGEERGRPPEIGLKGLPDQCIRAYRDMRRLKELRPELEIIVLSDTYGTVGQLGPLEPADEADTLAKLFLGHHRLPAHLVVEDRPFFHVEAPDGRRIDLPTPQMELLGVPRTLYNNLGGIAWFLDKEGCVVSVPELISDDRVWNILKNRSSK